MAKLVQGLEPQAGTHEVAGWVRLRGIAEAKSAEAGQPEVERTKEALRTLRARGLKSCVLLRWPAKDWKRRYLPEDLREAFARARWLGANYGDFVDAWEVDNEPDLGFVPESAERYAAFLKAMYLGLQAGYQTREESHLLGASNNLTSCPPLVLMAALGLPPGPWLERFAANDGFAYTDGYNYHYYGYADDFTGVYRQHEAAALELSTLNSQHSTAATKSLPVFLTEIGYGMLDQHARDTKEGRLRQWRWFKTVCEQTIDLRIEAPMAFYLPPYLEYEVNEFGLTVPNSAGQPKDEWTAGGIRYVPADFNGGPGTPAPWMQRIGRDLGGNQTTPALEQWLALRAEGRGQSSARAWTISAPTPSSVVIDFLPGEGLSFIKRFNGSFALARRLPTLNGVAATGSPRPAGESPKLAAAPRTEEFMLHVRTENGNSYEVYPTRQAGPEWQQYSEPAENFTLSFYSRASLPWRFSANRPASLVLVLYPKRLPATFELRGLSLVRPGLIAGEPDRYGRGTITLYNFSSQAVSGRLMLPPELSVADEVAGSITIPAGERIALPVAIKVEATAYKKNRASIRFEPEDKAMPVARCETELMRDIGGMSSALVGGLQPRPDAEGRGPVTSGVVSHRELVVARTRVDDEAQMEWQRGLWVQEGVKVEVGETGLVVTVNAMTPGKSQRVEVEIPWPDGLSFKSGQFLTLEYRLRP